MRFPTIVLFALTFLLAACATEPEDLRRPGDPEVAFEFTGNETLSATALTDVARRELRSFFEHGRRLADLDDAAQAMRRLYLEEGHAKAEVRFEAEPEDAPRMVRFEIEEGPRVTFAGVSFVGIRNLREQDLERFFAFGGDGIFGSGSTLYREDRVESAVTEVESAYLLEGYYDVKVDLAETRFGPEGTSAEVVVEVVEGRRYLLDAIEITVTDDGVSTGEVDAEDLRPAVAELVGRPFHARLAADCAGRLRRRLGDQGRLLAEIERKVELDREAGKAVIRLEVAPGPILELGDLLVEGRTRTALGFIVDRLELEEGEVLERRKLDDAISRLYATGLFANVRLESEPITSAGRRRRTDLKIELEEIESRTVDLEGGFGSYELLRGGVRFRDRNVLGIGRDFESALSASFRHVGAQLRFLDPYTLGADHALSFSANVQRREQPSFTSNAVDIEAAVRHRVDARTSLETGYRFRLADADEQYEQLDEAILTSALFARIRHDGRDDALLPTDGFFAEAGVAWSSSLLGADLDFVQLDLSLARLFPLGDGTVLALGLSARTRHPLADTDTLPIQERYFLGGESSVRSFDESELGPVDPQGDPAGGLSAIEGHIELRQRLSGDLQAALFYDLGAVSSESFSLGDLGHGVGVGLRYLLPFGPARLDFGYNPGRSFAADRPWALHFSFGFSF